MTAPTIHASAVLVGAQAVLIRGGSGSGKSRLAFELILAGRTGRIAPAVLIGDDRVHIAREGRQLIVRPAPALAGLIEIRGLGIRRCEYVGQGVVGLVVDLGADDAARCPAPSALTTTLAGIVLSRIPVAADFEPLPMVLAALTTAPAGEETRPFGDCPKGFGNHITGTIATL